MLTGLALCAAAALHLGPAVRHAPGRTAARGSVVRLKLEEAGALARAGDLGSSLEQALGSLPQNEKYNAVLESLLARRGSGTEASIFELVDEMTAKRIKLSNSAVKSLVDYGVEATNAPLVLKALSAGRANGALRTFASPREAKLSARPNAGALGALPAVPTDDRLTEVAAAATFSLVFGGTRLGWSLNLRPQPALVRSLNALLSGGQAWSSQRCAPAGPPPPHSRPKPACQHRECIK